MKKIFLFLLATLAGAASLCAQNAAKDEKEIRSAKLEKSVGKTHMRLTLAPEKDDLSPATKLSRRESRLQKEQAAHAPVANPPTLTSLTIDQAVDIAYKHKPDLKALKYQIQRARLNEKQVWTSYYPQIGFSSTLTDDMRSHQEVNTGFTVRQLVYDFAGPQETSKIAKTNTAIVKLQERAAQNDIRWQVENSYLSCWLLQQQREAVSALGKSSRVAYDKAVNSNNVQLLDKKDWLASAESHAQDVSTVYKYDDQVLSAQKALEYLMGYTLNLHLGTDSKDNKTTKLSWDYAQDVSVKSLEYYIQAAQKYRPEIRIAQKLVELRENEYSRSAKGRLPSLSVGASVNHLDGRDTMTGISYRNKSIYNCSGTVSWNVFDGFSTEYENQKIQAQKTEEMLKQQEAQQKVRSSVETAYHAVSQKIADLTAEKFKYTRAKNDFELAKQNLEIGIISKVEFESAKTAWENDQNSWLTKRIDVELKYRDLAYACGYFIELNI